ncbi:helix-turn-helix transcriptional regulator [Mycolicibacterium canariasense]|nr:helix-turn-helix transcriptional regulator [Mycolicibacterium canariasense]
MRVKDPDRIRRRRKRLRLSQADLAHLVRRSQQAISLIERGDMRNISEDFALALAARLDVDWEDLFEAHEIEVGTAVTSDVHSTGGRQVSA